MQYKVTKMTRTGVARFTEVVTYMTEDMVYMSFPSWKGDLIHRVGKYIYKIEPLPDNTAKV